jgi:hypothetical protein
MENHMPGKFEGCANQDLAESLLECINNGFENNSLGDVSDFGFYALILNADNGKSYVTNEDNDGFSLTRNLKQNRRHWIIGKNWNLNITNFAKNRKTKKTSS